MQDRSTVTRVLAVVALVAAAASAVGAQTVKKPLATVPGAKSDANSEANNGKFPTGWHVRNDTTYVHDLKDSVRLLTKAPGWAAKSGPSAILWSGANVAKGSFVIVAQTFLYPPDKRTLPGYGVFFGGRNLNTPNASYSEFLIRNDGKFSVRQHMGAKTLVLKDWTLVAGISQHSGKFDEMAGNRFRIVVDGGMVQFAVNRSVLFSLPVATVQPDGVFGIRIGAGQEMEIASVGLEKITPNPALVAPAPVAPKRPTTPQPLGKSTPRPLPAGVPTGTRKG